MFSSIIAGNTNDDVAVVNGQSNSFQSLGDNLIGSGNSFDSGAQNATDNFGQLGDQTGIFDPLLAPLANNGGPTLTHALLPGSPAIDMGDPAAMAGVGDVPLTDQRGGLYSRVYGGRIDIGAVESQPQHADFDGDGAVTGHDFLALQRGYGTPAPLAAKSDSDADDDTDVDGEDLAAWEDAYGASAPAPLVAVVGDDTARFEPRAVRSPATEALSHTQLVDLALAVHLNAAVTAEENPSPSPSLQGRGTEATPRFSDEAFAVLDDSLRRDEDTPVVLTGEHLLDLAENVAERDLAHERLQPLDDVPLGGELFPDL